MSAQDYRINAEVRRFLVSRWVDVSRLQLGTTNGVVYLMGALDTTVEDPGRRAGERSPGPGSSQSQLTPPPPPQSQLAAPRSQRTPAERVLHLAMSLEREIRRMRDVRDVVFKLENVFKRGGRWRVVETGGEARERAT